MPLPWAYAQDLQDEVIATRTRASLIDVTSVNLIDVTGPDAEAVIDRMVTIDVTRLKPGFGRIAAEVNDQGALCDDILVIRHAADRFRISHGSGATKQQLARCAEGKKVRWAADVDTHCLTLQGPTAASVLNPHCSNDLTKLAYFQFIDTTLFGKKVVISRSGYAGELGFEVYCASGDAVYLWDSILAAGKPTGVMAASWNCLEITRIESCLLFFPFEMPEGDTTPWEVRMHWAVDEGKKGDYIGKQSVMASKGNERFLQAGLSVKSSVAAEMGAKIFAGGREVGVVTSAGFSRYLMQSLAMVHLKPEATALGTAVEVRGPNQLTAPAHVVTTPFYDPLRLRTYPERMAR
jgi:aminomethyltransferase